MATSRLNESTYSRTGHKCLTFYHLSCGKFGLTSELNPSPTFPSTVAGAVPACCVSLRDRTACGASLGIVWALGYFGLATRGAILLDPTTALDAAIPFVGWTVWVYMAGIVWIAAPLALVDERKLFRRSAIGYVAALTLAFLCFAVLQTRAPGLRQEAALLGLDPLTMSALQTLRRFDTPTNLIPSLHVALAWLSSTATSRQRPQWRVAYILIAAAVTASVCLCKQHTLLDVAAGLVLAWFVSRLV